MKAEFARDLTNTNYISDSFLYVNNCGYYINIDFPLKVSRPEGRLDYQVIYISEGEINLVKTNENITIPSGHVIVFYPHQSQIYSVTPNKKTSYYWIHFSGTACQEILKNMNISKDIYDVGTFPEFCEGCKKIIHEQKTEKNETFISGIAISMLSRIAFTHTPSKFNDVISRMHKDIENKINDTDYSEISGLSKYHFIRKFKEEFSLTPSAYFTHLKIEKSKFLLLETNLKIKDIASLLCFEDPFYFSNVFKKHTGFSPSAYRASEL